jgi:hypothetical protein
MTILPAFIWSMLDATTEPDHQKALTVLLQQQHAVSSTFYAYYFHIAAGVLAGV